MKSGQKTQEIAPGTLPEEQVREMFDRISGYYDRMNSLMTAGLHHRWRSRAADLAEVRPGSRVLDVATGTGDLAIELVSRVLPGGEVVGVDFSEEMLAIARSKAPGVSFQCASALDLPFPDNSFDAATVGFGVRNFADLAHGIGELVRVVKPGGRVVILEITQPTKQPLATFHRVWFERLVPLIGGLSDREGAYSYLPNSVRRFPGPQELAALMEECGLSEIRYLLTAGSAIAIHVGRVPTTTL